MELSIMNLECGRFSIENDPSHKIFSSEAEAISFALDIAERIPDAICWGF